MKEELTSIQICSLEAARETDLLIFNGVIIIEYSTLFYPLEGTFFMPIKKNLKKEVFSL